MIKDFQPYYDACDKLVAELKEFVHSVQYAETFNERVSASNKGLSIVIRFQREWLDKLLFHMNMLDAYGPTSTIPDPRKVPDPTVRFQ